MEITVVHGQAHKGSTYHVSRELISHLEGNEKAVVHSFMLPIDGPNFCVGCFSCIYKGEGFCPHQEKMKTIVEALEASDVIIIDSPTYCFEMTGQLKTLFDHLGFMWMTHRPNGKMFNKVGVAISTAAGAGAKRVTKSIRLQFTWWGVGKSFRLPVLVNAKSYKEVSDEKKIEITKKTSKLAKKITKELGNVKTNFISKFLFKLMSMMHKTNTWNPVDKDHWEKQDWLKKTKPWRV